MREPKFPISSVSPELLLEGPLNSLFSTKERLRESIKIFSEEIKDIQLEYRARWTLGKCQIVPFKNFLHAILEGKTDFLALIQTRKGEDFDFKQSDLDQFDFYDQDVGEIIKGVDLNQDEKLNEYNFFTLISTLSKATIAEQQAYAREVLQHEQLKEDEISSEAHKQAQIKQVQREAEEQRRKTEEEEKLAEEALKIQQEDNLKKAKQQEKLEKKQQRINEILDNPFLIEEFLDLLNKFRPLSHDNLPFKFDYLASSYQFNISDDNKMIKMNLPIERLSPELTHITVQTRLRPTRFAGEKKGIDNLKKIFEGKRIYSLSVNHQWYIEIVESNEDIEYRKQESLKSLDSPIEVFQEDPTISNLIEILISFPPLEIDEQTLRENKNWYISDDKRLIDTQIPFSSLSSEMRAIVSTSSKSDSARTSRVGGLEAIKEVIGNTKINLIKISGRLFLEVKN